METAPKFNTRTLLIIGLVVIVGALFIIPRLNQGGAQDEVLPTVQAPNSNAPLNNNTGNAQIGTVLAASGVDRDGCAVNTASVFEPVEQVYVVAENSYVAAGTTVFVRLYQDGQAIEDAPEITADQDYNNSCINFVFEPETGARFERGQYEAEFIVNGNAAASVQFQIR
ncbi:MAG TPA: hypothetical protein VHO69_13445 [Phototrophicaceae bacterium]|nr:hypothetical protein [Phototrophicaceae bacterium]